jgi:hypothetical protein
MDPEAEEEGPAGGAVDTGDEAQVRGSLFERGV